MGYIFGHETETERLRVQARVWEPAAERLLDRIGVRAGSHCVDLGCGPVGILAPLRRRVGREGRVVGVELLAPQIAAARAHVHDAHLDGVEIVEADAFDTRLPRASFDLVHARFLMAPLGRAPDLLHEMAALARPRGVVAVEEPDQGSWEYVPPSRTWDRVKSVFEAVFPRFGGDANAGRRTFGMLRRLGLEDVHADAAVVVLRDRHPYMRTPLAGLRAMRRHVVEAGLMTDTEIDETLLEMARIVSDPDTYSISFTLTQAWGRKPAAA